MTPEADLLARVMLALCAIMQNAPITTHRSRTVWHNPGRAAYGAIRPMGGMSGAGSKRRRKRLRGGICCNAAACADGYAVVP